MFFLYIYNVFASIFFYAIFNIISLIIKDDEFPAVVTAAVPTTDETQITSVVETTSNALPCIQVVPVDEPEIVDWSIANEPEVGPV